MTSADSDSWVHKKYSYLAQVVSIGIYSFVKITKFSIHAENYGAKRAMPGFKVSEVWDDYIYLDIFGASHARIASDFTARRWRHGMLYI